MKRQINWQIHVVDTVENQINVFSLWAGLAGPYLGGIRRLGPKLDKTDRPKHQQPFLIGTISHFIIISLMLQNLNTQKGGSREHACLSS